MGEHGGYGTGEDLRDAGQVGWRGRVGDRVQQGRHRRPLVRVVRGEREHEDRAQGVDVRRGGQVLGRVHLLRCHAHRGADGLGGAGEVTGRGGQGGQAEVDHLRAVPAEQDVGRLEVAVQDARLMDGGERLGEADPESRGQLGRERPVLGHVLGEREAPDVLRQRTTAGPHRAATW